MRFFPVSIRNWRRNVRKSEKQGVEVTEGGLEELPEFL